MMKRPAAFKRKSKTEIALHIFVSLIFALVAFSYVYLLIWALLAGLKTHTEVVMKPFDLPSVWHWEHYIEVFNTLNANGHNFWEMLFNSCYFSILGPFINMFFCMTFSYCCTKYKFPGCEWPYTIILIMMTLPIYGSAGAKYRIIYNLGMIDSYKFVLLNISGMSSTFLYFRAFFKNLSWTYAEAAMMDGADEFGIYFRIMFPMSKPIFGALFLSAWLSAWASYENALVYLPNLPTLPVGIYQFNSEMIYRARLDILFAACVLISIPSIVLYASFSKLITTNVTLGGIKG